MKVLPEGQAPRKTDSSVLPILYFDDLRTSGIVRTWQSLNKWIDERDFPPGRMVGRFRVWTKAEVMCWLEGLPPTKLQPRGATRKRGADDAA